MYRTPYVKKWGDGVSVASTADEATVIWLKRKEEEKKLKNPICRSPDDNRNVYKTNCISEIVHRCFNNKILFGMVTGTSGFCLGVSFTILIFGRASINVKQPLK